MKIQILVIAAAMFLSHISNASTGVAQIERFDLWMRQLRATLTSNVDSTAVAKQLVDGDSRNATFHLQGLGRMYENQDPRFKTLVRDSFKVLEDKIGAYDMWKNIDKQKAEQAEKKLAELLELEGWSRHGQSPKLDEITEFIHSYNWSDYEADRASMLHSLQSQLNMLSQTSYDVTRLEKKDGDGNGLHELRREIRWFLIEAKVLNGLINYDQSPACSVATYEHLLTSPLANHKYATLNHGQLEVDPCLVQKCLVLGLVKSVNTLGEIKDASEKDTESREADRVTPSKLKDASDIYTEIGQTKVFSRLSENIGRCER